MGDKIREVVTSGRTWLWLHICGAVIWVGLAVPGMTVWRGSVPFLVFVSVYALILSHVVGAVAALGARKADPDDDV